MNALDAFTAARPDVEIDPAVLDDIAADVFDGRTRASVGPGRWRVPAVAAAAAVLALVVGLAAVVDRPQPIAPADTLPFPASDDVVPLAMLPEDIEPWSMIGQLSPPVERSVTFWSAVIAREIGGGAYDSPVRVQRGPSDLTLFRVDGFESEAVAEPVGLRDDRIGELIEDPAGGRLIVQFELGDGTAVSVSTAYREPLTGERARVLRIAANVQIESDDTARFDSIPDGFAVVAPWARDEVRRVRSVFFVTPDDAGPGFSLYVIAAARDDLATRGMDTELAPIEVRGRTGFISTHRYPRVDGVHSMSVVWEEQPGQWVRLEDQDPASRDALLAFAESLRVVTETEWNAAVEPIAGTAETPATTAPALPATVPPTTTPATTAPASAAASWTAPPGTVLVANAALTPGLAGQTTRMLELNGAQVTDPSDAVLAQGGALARTRVFARSGALELGEWTATELGVAEVEPIESLEGITIVSGFDRADVVVVLGLDRVPATAEVEQPIVFGDSVVLGAAGVLDERGYLVNAEVNRPLIDLVADVEAVVGGGLDPNIVVLHLGTNGPIRRDDLERLVAATAGVPNVIMINAHSDRDWIRPNNALLAEIDRPGDNIIMIDWATLATECPGRCFAADGIHLNETGAAYFADRLADITGY